MAVVLPFQPSGPVRLRAEFQTKVQYENRGSEHRVPFADQIRYRLGYSLRTQDANMQALRKALEEVRDQRVKVPDWTSGTWLTATASSSATSLTVNSLRRDWNCKEVIIQTSDSDYEVASVDALPTGTTISLSSGLASTWEAGAVVFPLREGVLDELPQIKGVTSTMSDLEIQFTEDYGNQFATGVYKIPGQFRNRPILDLIPDFDSPIESWEDKVEAVQLGFGNADLLTESEISIRRHSLGYVLEQTEAEQLLGVFAQSLGRARSFWLPSFRNNWRLAEDVAIYGSTIKLEQDGFLSRWENRDSDKFLAIVTDDVVTPVEVASVESSGGFDVVHLKDSLRAAADKDTSLVCELNLVRFASDTLEVRVTQPELSRATISAIEVPFEYEGKGEVSSRFDSVTAASSFQGLPAELCREVSLVNTTPNGLDIRRVGTSEILKLAGNHALSLSCSSPSEFEVRRTDLIGTGLSIPLVIEALNEEQPAWLYLFEAVVTPSDFVTRRFTSYHRDLEAGGQPFTSFNLNHSNIRRTSRLEERNLTINAIVKDSEDQLWTLVEEANPSHIRVTLYESKAILPTTDQILYQGVISAVSNPENGRLRFDLRGENELSDSQLGKNKLSQRCVVPLFSRWCKLVEADHQESGTIVAISESADGWPIIDCSLSGSRSASFFQGGKVTVGNEVRASAEVEKIGSDFRLYLSMPFKGAAVSGAITVSAGCDKAFPTCQGFSNEINFHGAPYLPPENPALEVFEIPQQDVGGKK